MSNDTATNSCTNWCGMIRLVEWKYKLIKTNHVGQVIFNSTNLIMPRQFVQNKFVQKFVAVSLLLKNYSTFGGAKRIVDACDKSPEVD